MRESHKNAVIRLLVCYLIAAAVQMLVLAVGLGEPHTGMGPVVVGAALIFWAAPFMTAVQIFSPSGLDPLQTKSLIYFGATFAICSMVGFRRELRTLRRESHDV